MKSALVVKMKEGYVVLPYSGNLVGVDVSRGHAVERGGYDSANLGKAIEAILRDEMKDEEEANV